MFLHAMWLAMTYLLGAFPFGLLVAKMVCGLDPRTAGSRNTGATNVARVCGFKFGVLALVLDIAKGAVPVLAAQQFTDDWRILSLTGLATLFGHICSVFLNFTGGKAVATTVGVFVALAPWAGLISVAACLAAIAITGFVSVGSLVLAVCLPVLALLTGAYEFAPLGAVLTLILFARHRENIMRLARGEENSWRKKK